MTAPGWLRARRADVLLAALVAAAQVGITAVAGRQQPGSRPLDALAVALLLGSAAALLVRRDHPVAALLVAGALTWVYWLPNYPGGPVFLALLVTLVGATHVNRAMTKLHARDRAQLVVVAYESGLVRPGWTD